MLVFLYKITLNQQREHNIWQFYFLSVLPTPRSSPWRTPLKWKSHCRLHLFISNMPFLLQYIFKTASTRKEGGGARIMFTLQINVVKTPSLKVPALNYHLVVWMKTSWQDWESEIKQCYQCHARCFSLAGWTKRVRSHYHFLWLRMPLPTPCQQCALQLCLKVVSGPIINSMNADLSGN